VRGYDAARTDRTNSAWLTSNSSADQELLNSANTIRARARDLVRNNAYARGVLKALVRNVVGCGIRPQCRIEGREDLNAEIESLFQRWARHADVTGRLTFYEIQKLAFQEVKEAGECLIHFTNVSTDRARPLTLALEMIDADRLADDMQTFRKSQTNDNEIRRGVELDANGRPVAYWIYPYHPYDVSGAWARPVRVPASECLHLFNSERIGQTRGVSMFAPVVGWLKQLGYYVENELQASAVASCFTAAVKTLAGPADSGLLSTDANSTDTDGNTFEYLQPGMVARLLPGEEIEVINPSRPNSQAEPWINLMLRSIAVGSGVSYERMARDYSQTNYSSARASDLEDRREFRIEQDWIVEHLCEPVWERFIETAVLEDKIALEPDELIGEYGIYTRHNWQKPGWEWVDPVKEATASQQALDANLTTLADELGQRGRDLHDTLMQRAYETELIRDLGLSQEELGDVTQG
jgi:lambda family phage portal protein